MTKEEVLELPYMQARKHIFEDPTLFPEEYTTYQELIVFMGSVREKILEIENQTPHMGLAKY